MTTLYIEPDEEITSIIDRLARLKEKEVALVIPRGNQILQSLLNLKLLKRESESLGKNVFLVASDEISRELAHRAGLGIAKGEDFQAEMPTVVELDSKEEEESFLKESSEEDQNKPMADIVRPKTESRKKKEDLSSQSVIDSDLAEPDTEQIVKIFQKRPSDFGKKPNWLAPKKKIFVFSVFHYSFLFFIILALLVIGACFYFIFPRAKIIIQPKTEPYSLKISVVGEKDSTSADLSNNRLPIQMVQVEEVRSKEFEVKTEKELSQKARGTIVVYNAYSSQPQTLVKRTRFLSKEGKLFRTTRTIIVPGAKVEDGKIVPNSIEVEVLADEPGEEYNIGPTEFTIPGFKGSPKYKGFYGRSFSPMTGGAQGKVKVLTEEELNSAKEDLINEIKQKAQEKIHQSFPSGLEIIPQSLVEEEIEFLKSVEPDTVTDKFTLEAKLTLKAILYKIEDLNHLIENNLAAVLPENKVSLTDSRQISWSKPDIDWEKGRVSFDLYIHQKIASKINQEKLKEDLIGRNEEEVKEYLLKSPEIKKAKVIFWPFWIKRMPWQTDKIKIIIDLDEKTKID